MYAILANKHLSASQILDIFTFTLLVVIIFGLIVLHRAKSEKSRLSVIGRAIVKSLVLTLGIIVFAITSSRLISKSEDYSDDVHSIYRNDIGAEVSFYKDGMIFTGGENVNTTVSSTDVIYRSDPRTFENKLIVKKNKSKVIRKVEHVELIVDKSW